MHINIKWTKYIAVTMEYEKENNILNYEIEHKILAPKPIYVWDLEQQIDSLKKIGY